MGLFDSLFSPSSSVTGPLKQAYNTANTALNTGLTQGNKALNPGVSNAAPAYGNAAAAFSPYNATGTAANTLEGNALGVNGAAGNAAATAAFQASPGYQYTLNQGLQGVERNAASLGNTGSGNTMEALDQYGTNLANNEYQNWLGNLQGLGGQGLQGAAGQANELNQLGNLFQTQGQNLSSNYTGTAGELANNASQYGSNLAGVNQASNITNAGLLGSGLTGLTKLLGTGTASSGAGSTLLGTLLAGL